MSMPLLGRPLSASPAETVAASRHEAPMRRALELARCGRGLTSPNPMVGAVVVREDRIVGEGFHRYEEKKHAEIWALEQAGYEAQGATLYVTLEPCSHHGRTPPCTEQVIQAGVASVVAAIQDPNPLVAGGGFHRLADAGIKVECGVCQSEAIRLNEAYAHFIRTRRPFITLKTAMTLDGKVAQPDGRSQWITGQPSRDYVQQLRFESDAVMTGIGTVLTDDPFLTDRTNNPRRRRLLRVVLDASLRLPLESRLVRSCVAEDLLVFCAEDRIAGQQKLLEALGAEVVAVPASAGKVDLAVVLDELGRREITSLLLEAGPQLNFAALQAGLVSKLLCFVAPKILGGSSALPVVGGPGVMELERAFRVRFDSIECFGEDLLLAAYVCEGDAG